MTITQQEAVLLVFAIALAGWWWLGRLAVKREAAEVMASEPTLPSRQQDLLVRFRSVVINERARERVLRYYQEKYPHDPIECVLEKILCDYHADNDRVTGGRWFMR